MWRSAAALARTHVEPVLRDPSGKLLEPVGRFLGEKASEARVAERRTGEGTALAGAALGMRRAAKMTLAALLLAEALGYAGFFAGDEDRQWNESMLGEYEDGSGIRRVRRTFRRYLEDWWDQARSPGGILFGGTWGTWGDRFIVGQAFRQDVVRPLREAYESLYDKHKFALGVTAGLTYSPSLFALGGKAATVVKWTAAVYVLAEVANAMGRGRRRSSRPARVSDLVDTSKLRKFAREFNLDDEIDDAIRAANRGLRDMAGSAVRDGFDILEDTLEELRMTVRRAVRRPTRAVDGLVIWVDENREAATGAVLGSVLGHLL